MIRTQSTPAIPFSFLLITLFSAHAQTATSTMPQASPAPQQASVAPLQPNTATQSPTNTQPKKHKGKTLVSDGQNPAIHFPDVNDNKPNQPRCSTEIANGSCYVNINRLYPYSYPGFTMKPAASVTVIVFNPFSFEKLTVEPSAPANIYQGTDQFGSLVTAIAPGLKGTTIDGTSFHTMSADNVDLNINANIADFAKLSPPPTPSVSQLEKDIETEESDLKGFLDDAVKKYIDPYTKYKDETNEIYRQVRLVSLAVPRPVADRDQRPINQGVFEPDLVRHPDEQDPCFKPSDPWHTYDTWHKCMIKDLLIQGDSGSNLWKLFPNKCQANDLPWGPWTVPTPTCSPATDTVEPAHGPQVDPSFNTEYAMLLANLKALLDLHDSKSNYDTLKKTADFLHERDTYVVEFLSGILGAVPATLTKISTDMQNFYIALLNAPQPDPVSSINLGTLYGPSALDPADKKVVKYLGVPMGLAPSITYNVNGQNLVTTTLLSAPATTQRTLIAAIPLTFANPRFETSTGVFLSFLNNRTFANTTEVAVAAGTSNPTPTDVKITETVTNKPLIIPYYAAHFRPFDEWIWPGGRRGAFYLTGALGINPYQTDLEYAAGFSISWRYLIFSPVYHLGRSTHLTSGEQVGQVYCVYPGASNPTMAPACSSAPPAPTTKNYLTGAFAIGIGVRIPTTFASTNK